MHTEIKKKPLNNGWHPFKHAIWKKKLVWPNCTQHLFFLRFGSFYGFLALQSWEFCHCFGALSICFCDLWEVQFLQLWYFVNYVISITFHVFYWIAMDSEWSKVAKTNKFVNFRYLFNAVTMNVKNFDFRVLQDNLLRRTHFFYKCTVLFTGCLNLAD